MLAVLDRVLGEYQLSAPTGIEIGAGEVAQPLHPDDALYPIPRPHTELVVNVMWPLDDFTEANGATRIVPGSHRWGDEFPGPDTETVAIEMPAGSALDLPRQRLARRRREPARRTPGSAWCCTTPSAGCGRSRTTCSRYRREVVAGLPERLQELLGYNICSPFIGYVDGRHPRRLLDPEA